MRGGDIDDLLRKKPKDIKIDSNIMRRPDGKKIAYNIVNGKAEIFIHPDRKKDKRDERPYEIR